MTEVLPGWAAGFIGFLFGSCIGSFLNVCIYRLPREQSVIQPPSRCPQCESLIAWYDNIPILSWLLLGARCRECKKTIPWRYPLVEAGTGLAFAAVLSHYGFNLLGGIYAAFVAALIASSVIDLDFQIIPDEISLGGLVVGLGLSFLVPALHATASPWVSLGRSLVGMLVGGGVLYGTGILGDILFRKESMGGGDIKLLAMAGSILGWKLVIFTFFIAPMLALIPGLVVLFVKRSHVIPYGPFLSLGLVLALFAGNNILRVTGFEDSIRLLWEYRPWFR